MHLMTISKLLSSWFKKLSLLFASLMAAAGTADTGGHSDQLY
jgi:hypothetical protein